MVILLVLPLTLFFLFMMFLFFYHVNPSPDKIDTTNIPNQYVIKANNRIETQSGSECAAFSSAYILRHYGNEAKGIDLYKKFPGKFPDGTVTTKGILRFFKKLHYHVRVYHGDINTLKKQVSLGVPVIIFFRVHPEQKYLHFAPVVGYDEDNLFLAESLPFMRNCDETYYNRKLAQKDFIPLWNTWVPFHVNSYIVVSKG